MYFWTSFAVLDTSEEELERGELERY